VTNELDRNPKKGPGTGGPPDMGVRLNHRFASARYFGNFGSYIMVLMARGFFNANEWSNCGCFSSPVIAKVYA
jgi:hypothetical protein